MKPVAYTIFVFVCLGVVSCEQETLQISDTTVDAILEQSAVIDGSSLEVQFNRQTAHKTLDVAEIDYRNLTLEQEIAEMNDLILRFALKKLYIEENTYKDKDLLAKDNCSNVTSTASAQYSKTSSGTICDQDAYISSALVTMYNDNTDDYNVNSRYNIFDLVNDGDVFQNTRATLDGDEDFTLPQTVTRGASQIEVGALESRRGGEDYAHLIGVVDLKLSYTVPNTYSCGSAEYPLAVANIQLTNNSSSDGEIEFFAYVFNGCSDD